MRKFEGKGVVHTKIAVDESVIARMKKLLAGAPKHVSNHRLSVGIHEGEAKDVKLKYDGGESTIDLVTAALINEMGLADLPERSWLRSWFDANEGRLREESVKAMREEAEGDTEAVPELARKWGDELAQWLESNSAGLEELAESTKEARKKAGLADGPPLVATGQLLKAIRGMADSEYVK